MNVRSSSALVSIMVLLAPGIAAASVAIDPNPFHTMNLCNVLLASEQVRIVKGGLVELRHTGDTIALDSIASDAMSAPIDGRYVLVVPFQNARHAEHSALVFAADGPRAYAVGGFSTKRDHLTISLSDTIDVTFFSAPSHGKTLAAGGPAPTSTSHLIVVAGRLATVPEQIPATTVATSPT